MLKAPISGAVAASSPATTISYLAEDLPVIFPDVSVTVTIIPALAVVAAVAYPVEKPAATEAPAVA